VATLPPLQTFAESKTAQADEAAVMPLETIEDRSGDFDGQRIGNEWTRRMFGGDYLLLPAPRSGGPAVSLVFVESRDGNTGAPNPEVLGGGPTDMHFLYEGLSRVAADAVLVGAGSARGPRSFFSVWRSELTGLRRELGLPRHPIQVVVSGHGHLEVDKTLLFNAPEARVIVLAGDECRAVHARDFAKRPWITVLPFSGNWREALAALARDHGVRRISAVGGRHTATSLIDAGVVQDLGLTTSNITGGEPHTPYYIGDHPPALALITRKRQPREPFPITFEHLSFGETRR
jgi:riboflavin biosynthesis pyrimidine reductase